MTAAGFRPGFLVIHGNRAEDLRDLLLRWMAHYPPAPLERDLVITQSNGIAQWLNFSLAAQDETGLGIAAGVDMALPARFLWRCYRAVLGTESVPEVSPLDKDRLVWRLMRLLPTLMTQPGYEPLARFLQDDADRRRHLQLAQRLADLYDQYQVYRADWLSAWAAGQTVVHDARGQAHPLVDNRWQALLWQAILADIEDDPGIGDGLAGAGRAAVHAAFLQAAQQPDAPRPKGLPRRVFVFGLSNLPAQSLEVLGAIARWSQVILCVQNPCRHHWAEIIDGRDLARVTSPRHPRRPGMPESPDPDTLHQHAQPLLAAWGRQGRDFMALLSAYDDPAEREAQLPALQSIGEAVDVFVSPGAQTLLHQLQDDILELRALDETRDVWPAVDPARDHSLRFHIAHSPQREVEILHDRLLAALEADDNLQPRDCLVMVPDIATYAPHIEAVFGLHDGDDPRAIPFSIADQGPREREPMIQAVEQLLRLGQARLSVSEWLDLLEVPALRRRFGIDETDIPRLHRWVARANVRWGLHASHVQALGLPAEDALRHTWQHGLRRLFLGYATGPDTEAWQDIEPQGEVGGLEAALLGPLEALINQLESMWAAQQQAASVDEWVAQWRQWLAQCFAPESRREQAAMLALESALRDWLEAAESAGYTEPLPASVVADAWMVRLDEQGLSQRFFGGAVTFATLMPMRAIPFRFVALLGMNDGDYPRARAVPDFDLMRADYRPGDRSRREDDRYLFLEALLSAREHLHCSWVGRSVIDNTPRPPSVLVGQLRDHLAAGWRLAGDQASGGEALLQALTTEHPLQPFNARYFQDGHQTGIDGLYTYAHEWRASPSAEDHAGAIANAPPLSPPATAWPLDLAGLQRFLRDPPRVFFEDRLGVVLNQRLEAIENEEVFALNALDRWRTAEAFIEAPESLAQALARGVRAGDIPAAGVGHIQAEQIGAEVAAMLSRRDALAAEWPQVRPGCWVGYPAYDPWLQDRLDQFRATSDDQSRLHWRLEPGKLYDKGARYDRLVRPWLAHLLANAAIGATETRVFSVSGEAAFAALEREVAAEHLDVLQALWRQGLTRALPLAPRTAFAWLAKQQHAQAEKAYVGDDHNPGEVQRSPYLARAYPNYAALTASGEFMSLAQQVFAPLVAAVEISRGEAE